MPGILIIAHAPLASALSACARHVHGAPPQRLEALDVEADTDPQQLQRDAAAAIARLAQGDDEVLVLADAAGATPCNAARRIVFGAVPGVRLRLLGGVNLPMLLRALCYRHEALDQLATRALEGGRRAVDVIEPDDPVLHEAAPGLQTPGGAPAPVNRCSGANC